MGPPPTLARWEFEQIPIVAEPVAPAPGREVQIFVACPPCSIPAGPNVATEDRWGIETVIPGRIFSPGAGGHGMRGRTTTLAICLAAAIPTVTAPLSVHAAPPTLPADPVDPTAPPTSIDPGSSGSTDGSASRNAAPPAPSASDDELAMTGYSLWAGLVGQRVILEVDVDGQSKEVRGELISQSDNLLALAIGDDGRLASVDKGAVRSIRLADDGGAEAMRQAEFMPSGVGMLIGGGLLVGVGTPLLIAGLQGLQYSPFYGLAFGLPGAVGIAAGIPLLVIGAKRHKKQRQAMGFAQVTPNVRVGKRGAVAGVSLRF